MKKDRRQAPFGAAAKRLERTRPSEGNFHEEGSSSKPRAVP
jgi:hypothetical protein